MRALATVFAVKIVITIALWVVPLLLFPVGWLAALGFPIPEPLIFLRLLGMAFLSLTLAYTFGLRAALRGDYPSNAIWVGILSNGGSFFILLIAALCSSWDSWGTSAKAAMWFFLAALGTIAAALVAFGPLRKIP